MALIRISSNEISNAGYKIKSECNVLKELLNNLKNDVDVINTIYSGVDSEKIVLKYNERMSMIKNIIDIYETYANYMMKNMADVGEVHDTSLKSVSNTISSDDVTSVLDSNLSFSSIEEEM